MKEKKNEPLTKKKWIYFIIKLCLFIIISGGFFYFAFNNNIILLFIFGIIGLVILTKMSKKEAIIIKNLLFRFSFIYFYILFFGLILITSIGMSFAFKDIELIKFMITLSFALAGITFIGVVTNKDSINQEILKNSIMSSLFFTLSGLMYLFEIGARVIESVNPFNSAPISIYNIITSLSPLMGFFAMYPFALATFMMVHSQVKKIKEFGQPSYTKSSFKEFIQKIQT